VFKLVNSLLIIMVKNRELNMTYLKQKAKNLIIKLKITMLTLKNSKMNQI